MKRLVIKHDSGFELLAADQVGDAEVLGERTVLTANGDEKRSLVRNADLSETVCELPDDYEGAPQELVHLMQTWNDRHFDKPVSVSGDPTIGPRMAALMGVPFQEDDE